MRSLVCVGSSVLVLLPIRRWAGEVPRPSVGVFLQSKKASSGSLLSARAFFNRFLQILTVFSAFPFDWGWCGLEVLCSNFHASANFANSDELNCVPLSVIRTSGIPCLANCTLQAVMTVVEVIRLSSCTLNNWNSSRPVLRSFVDQVRIGQLLLSTTDGLAFRAAGGLLYTWYCSV